MKTRSPYRNLLVLCLTLTAPTVLTAQVAGGTITGTVADTSGSLIPKAHVDITNRATGVTRSVITNDDGFYTAPNLVPGEYEVKATAAGFAPEGTNLTLTVGDVLSLSLSLKVGGVDQKIEIIEAPPAIEFSSSALGAVVAGPVIRDLPLNGRSWTDLATLQPGVAGVYHPARLRPGRGTRQPRIWRADHPSPADARHRTTTGLTASASTTTPTAAPAPSSAINLGVDAIGEFSVLTSNYSAEYGKTSGGVINAVTRSGTNQFHGSAYSFFRNSALDARNYFDGRPPPPPVHPLPVRRLRRRAHLEGPHLLLRRLRGHPAESL